MQRRIVGGFSAGVLVLLLAGCSSATSSPTTTTTSTTEPATAVSGASSPEKLGAQFAGSLHAPTKFCTTYAVPSQVPACTSDLSQGGVSLKNWKVGHVTVLGDQAVITFTGTACQGSQCVSNSDPNAATDPESAMYAGSSFAATFAAANDPNNQNNSPFIAAAVQQGGTWYASGF